MPQRFMVALNLKLYRICSIFVIIMLDEKFDPNALYNRVVHYYIDKKGYSKEKANALSFRVPFYEITYNFRLKRKNS